MSTSRRRRLLTLPLALALLVAPRPAPAEVQSLGPPGGPPLGLVQPLAGAAAAEEATATAVNPAGLGFVQAPAFQYLHQEDAGGQGGRGDGFYLAGLLGPIGPGLSVEWVRPGDGGGPRYRLTTLALALGDGEALSIGGAWRWWSSPDAALEALHAWDLGLTLRPSRWLSLAASAQGHDARLAGLALPVRYDLGLATRLLGDTLTLSADLLADDRSRNDLHATHLGLGAALALRGGLALTAQVRLPLRSAPDVDARLAAVVALAWNGPHTGWIAGGTARGGEAGWLAGLRLSRERYRAAEQGREVPRLDLARELQPGRRFWILVGDRDPFGTLLARLEQARDDAGVAGLVLQIGPLDLGGGRVEELRELVREIAARKPVVAWLQGGGTKEYWLASAATLVALQPSGTLVFSGLSHSGLYLKEGLARLGIAFEVARAGAYKSAPEPLTRTEASPEARQMTGALLDDVAARLLDDVAKARRLEPSRVRALVDQGLFAAADAKAAGLVDAVLWPDELEGWLKRTVGHGVELTDGYRPAPRRRAQRWGHRPVLAVVPVQGAIAAGRSRREPVSGGSIAGAESVVGALQAAVRDDQVRAIVLRVESPGGDAQASDLIWREVVRAARKKPVIASMGDLAASGGYLVAVGADTIVAEPSTLTGSIGVFGLKPDLSGLLAKLGVGREVQRRGENAELFSVGKPWTPSERAAVERTIDALYSIFLDRVAAGRKLPRAEVEPLAGGRVWTGRQARDRGLVDRLGGLAVALDLARERTGLAPGAEVELRRFDGPDGGMDLASPAGDEAAGAIVRGAAALLPELRTAALLGELGPVLALPAEWLAPAPAPEAR